MIADFVPFAGAVFTFAGLAALPLLALPVLTLIWVGPMARPACLLAGFIDRISGLALNVAAVAAFAIVLFQLAAVLVRYSFGLGFSWLTDAVVFCFATIFMLGAAAGLRDDTHVRVDIMRTRFGARIRAIIELVGAMFFICPVGILILYAGGDLIARAWTDLEPFNESDGLPVKYLFKTLVPVFALLMTGQGLAQALKAALELRGVPLPPKIPHTGPQPARMTAAANPVATTHDHNKRDLQLDGH